MDDQEKEQHKLSLLDEQYVLVPRCTDHVTTGNVVVRKIVFKSVWDEACKSLHPAPDPVLLTVKAACNWSTRQGWPLVAGGYYEEDSDTESVLPSWSAECEARGWNV